MNEDDIVRFVASLPGVAVVVAGEDTGAPEVAWGDSFFFYDPDGNDPAARKMPFATIVTKDYPGFDTVSNLDRPDVFRLNIGVGRRRYQELFGHAPAAHADHGGDYDYAALDRVLPHPVYAAQGWASILNPGEASAERARELLTEAHARAAERYHLRER